MALWRRGPVGVIRARWLGIRSLAFLPLLASAPALAQVELGPWDAVDLGAPPVTKSITLDAGCITAMVAGGDALGDRALFVHQELPGNGALEIHFKSTTSVLSGGESVSVVFRESLIDRHSRCTSNPLKGVGQRSAPGFWGFQAGSGRCSLS